MLMREPVLSPAIEQKRVEVELERMLIAKIHDSESR